MRVHPLDWGIEDLEAVARGFGINIRRPGGSHVHFTHSRVRGRQRTGRRPIKPAHVRAFVLFVDLRGKHDPGRALPLHHPAFARGRGRRLLIEFPDLPGCMSDGATIEEAAVNRIDIMPGWIEAMRAEGIRSPRRPTPRRPEPLVSGLGVAETQSAFAHPRQSEPIEKGRSLGFVWYSHAGAIGFVP